MLPENLTLPDDLHHFYQLCGGAVLFDGAPFEWTVSGPHQLRPASPRLLGDQLAQQIATEDPDDLTNGCFVFAESGTGGTAPLVVVDLNPARAGRYYDALWDSYGLAGDMPIIALTAAELIRHLLDTRGEHVIDLGPVHGDAYDNISPHT